MIGKQAKASILISFVILGSILPALCAPPTHHSQGRKYAVKSNNPKKVFHKQLPTLEQQQQQQQQQAMQLQQQQQEQIMNKATDIGTASDITGGSNGGNPNFPWSFLSNSLRQLFKIFFGMPNELNGNGLTPGSDKMDGPSAGQGFSWGQVIGYGLKLLFVTLGGNDAEQHDGIDKIGVEGGAGNPVQGLMKTLIGTMIGGGDESGQGENIAKQTGELINLVIALMNALKTSFSQRSILARSLGESNKLNDFTLATIDMSKAYVKTMNETTDGCKQQRICEAARECITDVESKNSGLCHFISYATVNLMYYTQSNSKNYKSYLDASRKGRATQNQQDCKRLFVCNEVM